MKITLEFNSQEEHDEYVQSQFSHSTTMTHKTKEVSLTFKESGLNRKYHWTDWDVQFLVQNWGKKNGKWIAKSLGKTQVAVLQKANSLRAKGVELPLLRHRRTKVIEGETSQ